MARFRPADPDDPPQGRIDGYVYDSSAQTPTIRLWTPVQQHPSLQWDRFNSALLQLDRRYPSLSDSQRDGWDGYADADPWTIYCDLDDWWELPTPDVDRGLYAYHTVNLSRLMQGVVYTDDIPGYGFGADGDALTLVRTTSTRPAWPPPAGWLLGLWTREGLPVVDSQRLLVSVCGLSHAQEEGLTSRRYRFACVVSINQGVPFDLGGVFAAFPGLYGLNYLAVRALVASEGLAPYVALHQGVDLRPGGEG